MKRKGRRYDVGGDVPGYEEDPKPGSQSKNIGVKKVVVKKTSPRKVSSMEFVSQYDRLPPSQRMMDDAEDAARDDSLTLPGDRSTGFKEQRGIARGAINLDREAVERGLEGLKTGAEALLPGAAVAAIEGAQIPLRIKQMMRARQIARANEANRAADRAGEAARRGMSRRNMPSSTDRYRARTQAAEDRAARQEQEELMSSHPDLQPRQLYGRDLATRTQNVPDWGGEPWRKGGHIKGYKKGGVVKSSASSRGDGIAQRGKTKGRMV